MEKIVLQICSTKRMIQKAINRNYKMLGTAVLGFPLHYLSEKFPDSWDLYSNG